MNINFLFPYKPKYMYLINPLTYFFLPEKKITHIKISSCKAKQLVFKAMSAKHQDFGN